MDEKVCDELYRKGEYQVLITRCTAVIREQPRCDLAYAYRAVAQRALLHFEDAIKDANDAIALNENNDMAWRVRGGCRQDRQQNTEALQDLERAVELNRQSDKNWAMLSSIHNQMENFEKGLACGLESIKLNPDNLFALVAVGLSLRMLDRADEAIPYFSYALDKQPKYYWAYAQRGSAKKMLGDHQGAVADYTQAIQLDADTAFAWLERGRTKFYLDDYEGAKADLAVALKLEPQHAGTWELLANVYWWMDDYPNVISACNKSLGIDPDRSVALRLRGSAKRMTHDYDGALLDVDVSLRLNPSNYLTWMQRGLIKEYSPRKPDLQQARRDYLEGLRLKPGNAFLTKRLAEVEDKLGVARTIIEPQQPVFVSRSTSQQNPVPIVKGNQIPASQLNIAWDTAKSGRFGHVFFGTWSRAFLVSEKVAVKQLNSEQGSRLTPNLQKEIDVHSALKCPQIVEMFGIAKPLESKPWCIVMEYMDSGSLRELFAHFPSGVDWAFRFQIADDITKGLVYLHEQTPQIVHGDIQPSNILLNKGGYAKLIDFGLSTLRINTAEQYYTEAEIAKKQSEGSHQGMLRWVAPELYKPRRKTPACDMYSYGMLLWFIAASGRLPYSDSDESMMVYYKQQNEKEEYDDELTPDTPEAYQAVSNHCWDADPQKRLTAKAALVKLHECRLYQETDGVRLLFPTVKISEKASGNASPPSKYFGK